MIVNNVTINFDDNTLIVTGSLATVTYQDVDENTQQTVTLPTTNQVETVEYIKLDNQANFACFSEPSATAYSVHPVNEEYFNVALDLDYATQPIAYDINEDLLFLFIKLITTKYYIYDALNSKWFCVYAKNNNGVMEPAKSYVDGTSVGTVTVLETIGG